MDKVAMFPLKSLAIKIGKLCTKKMNAHSSSIEKKMRKKKNFEKRLNNFERTESINHPHPISWEKSGQFNPFKVRPKRYGIAHAILKKIAAGTYKPKETVTWPIRKASGGYRYVEEFTIPDAALAKLVYDSLLDKYDKHLGVGACAYRKSSDSNMSEIICEVKQKLKGETGIQIKQVDFKNYFPSISLDWLEKQGQQIGIDVAEVNLIRAFFSRETSCPTQILDEENGPIGIGLPQGCALSQFLGNLAALPLDTALDDMKKEGVKYWRFVDDLLIVVPEGMPPVQERVDHAIDEFLKTSGIEINSKKSTNWVSYPIGHDNEPKSINFLGYNFAKEGVSIRERTLSRAKAKISRIIYEYLLAHPRKQVHLNGARVFKKDYQCDWDLVGCIMSIRGYLYGRLSARALTVGIRTGKPPQRMKKSFCSFLSETGIESELIANQLSALDGWLVNAIQSALKKRKALLDRFWAGKQPEYLVPSQDELRTGHWYKPNGGRFYHKIDPRLPCFYLGWRYGLLSGKAFGLPKAKYLEWMES